jgi:hypothetical protein
VEEHSQAFSFAFFAPSRETNLLSKFAHFGECTLRWTVSGLYLDCMMTHDHGQLQTKQGEARHFWTFDTQCIEITR